MVQKKSRETVANPITDQNEGRGLEKETHDKSGSETCENNEEKKGRKERVKLARPIEISTQTTKSRC